MEPKEEHIPFHTRFGLRFLQVLLIVFALVLVQRCVALYHDNKVTSEELKTEYFEKGYDSGLNKARGLSHEEEPQFRNYALKQAYRDGFRQGWDKGREK
jgi:hypothetical protein